MTKYLKQIKGMGRCWLALEHHNLTHQIRAAELGVGTCLPDARERLAALLDEIQRRA
jgi:hypothetical protein